MVAPTNSEARPEPSLDREPATRVEREANAGEQPERSPSREAAPADPERKAPIAPHPSVPTPRAPQLAAPYVRDVEEILSEDLTNFFQSMTPAQQQTFKQQGESTARTISTMIQQARVQAKRILLLITTWLKFIPGVNRFYLEQEAKIKTDKILALAQEEERRRVN